MGAPSTSSPPDVRILRPHEMVGMGEPLGWESMECAGSARIPGQLMVYPTAGDRQNGPREQVGPSVKVT